MRLKNNYALSAFAGVSLVGALAGCSSTVAGTGGATATPASTEPSGTASSASTPSAANYTDGSYTADGSYQSPAGTGTITVNVTLAGGVVTAITTNGHATDPTAKAYQGDFDAGIAGKVVGKKIDSLNVTNVSGSSLTSGGFDQAIMKIEAQARA